MEVDQTSTSSLQARIKELEEKQTTLLAEVESKENEFGVKRAQFKEIFLQKETELNREVSKLKSANEENAKLLSALNEVTAERDNLKTAVLITETSNDDQFQAMKFKYQEEIASLKAIMHDAVQEARQETSEKYEEDQVKLVVANQNLEAKVLKYKTQLKELKSRQQPQDPGDDELFDVLSGPWKPASPSEEAGMEQDENLEDSMKKAQEDAEALRSIVMPLEEEIAALKSKLKHSAEKIAALEAREKKSVKSDQNSARPQDGTAGALLEGKDEKIKELTQYLEAERSSRTDLEMFVAVLNTQKGVLQEDAEKLRRELHNVCRLLEQEKEEHVALKDTWEMANDRFLETQRVQRIELEKIKKMLTLEQHQELDEELQTSKEPVELLPPPSPATKRRFLNRKAQKQPTNKRETGRTLKDNAADAKRTLSSLVRGPKANNRPSSPSSSILDSDIPQLDEDALPLLPNVSTIPCATGSVSKQPKIVSHENILEPDLDGPARALSDSEGKSETSGRSMKKCKSADDLKKEDTSASASGLRTRSQELGNVNKDKLLTVEDISDRTGRRKEIDWKSFEEAAKSSLSADDDRSCAMCSNYEKQLQKLQGKNEELAEETSILSNRLKEEQETVTVVKRAYERLEQSVKTASEDAQLQINAAFETQRNLESLLEEINVDIDNTKKETAQQVNELMVSRDSILAKMEQLSENCNALQFNSMQQINQAYSGDSELNGLQEKLQIYQAASRTKEEKLQSEINFMKDRVMAEQVAKESLEEMYQVEIDSLGQQIRQLKEQLDKEKQRNKQLEQQSSTEGNAPKEVIAILETQLQQSSKDKADLEKQLRGLKCQLHSLNGQLNNSEAVQRDFVKLSQSLQMELEEMKESKKEIRWEHEDDVSSCRKCEKKLSASQQEENINMNAKTGETSETGVGW